MKRRIQQFVVPLLASMLVIAGLTAGVSARGGLDLPSWAGQEQMQAGPLGLNPKPQDASVPVSLNIPDANVDSEVERNQIVDGVMLDPSGPWVVSWYEETGMLGDIDNVVMSGHVDYWDVGPSVFWEVGSLAEGAEMHVRGDDGATYTYAVEWVRTYDVAGLTPETINEIVGRTEERSLTLITCGGDFNYDTGEYLSRTVIRGTLVRAEGVPTSTDIDPSVTEDTQPDPADEVQTLEEAEDATSSFEEAETGSDGTGGTESDGIAIGGTVAAIDDGLNVRSAPSTEGAIVGVLNTGQQVAVVGGPESGSGYTWWQVQLGDGTQGWVAEDFIAP